MEEKKLLNYLEVDNKKNLKRLSNQVLEITKN